MATYKIIQDIETEDKLLGPLSLRQFIYAGVTVLFGYLSFLSINKHFWFMLILFVPIMAGAAFFAFPWSINQSTETWALAKVRFMFKPRRRVWDQSGVKELVTITAPKRQTEAATRHLSPIEVQSRLKSLADTIDSRGWTSKNINVNMYSPEPMSSPVEDSERLVSATTLPQPATDNIDIHASDDMLDEQNSAIGQNVNKVLAASAEARKRQLAESIKQAAASTPMSASVAADNRPVDSHRDEWFTGDPRRKNSPNADYVNFNSSVVAPHSQPDWFDEKVEPTAEEKELAKKLKASHNKPKLNYSHMRVIQPMSVQKLMEKARKHKAKLKQSAKLKPSPAIIKLLSRNNDRSLESLSREVNKPKDDGEIVVNLH